MIPLPIAREYRGDRVLERPGAPSCDKLCSGGALPAGEGFMTLAANLASFGLSFILATGAAAQAPPAPPPELKTTPVVEHGAPVRLDGETLYYVHDFMGILSPEDRAITAERKLKNLAEDPFYSEELFTVDQLEGAARIHYREDLIALVSKEDAAAIGAPVEEIAANRLATIKRAVARHHANQLPQAKTRALVATVVATMVLVLLLIGVRRAYRRLVQGIGASRAGRLAAAAEARLGLRAEQLLAVELRLLRFARIAVDILLVVIYLQIIFTFLPLTRGFALAVLQYLLDPIHTLWQGFLRSIGDIFTIAVLVVLTRFALKGMRWLLYEAAAGEVTIPGIASEWGVPLYKIVRIVIVALAAVMIYPYVPGSGTDAFKGLSLFAGALFTLGASGTVGNFIGGLVAIFVGTFRIGDVVKMGDVLGVVTEMTMTLTRIRTPMNTIVSVPNIAIMSGQLVNYSTMARTDGVILTTSVTIGYDAPWRKVHALLLEAAGRTARIEKAPAPFVLQTSLDDFYVSYQLNAYTKDPVFMRLTYGELHQNIQDAFNEGGVEIMSPHYASLRDGNTVTIPEDKRDKGYEAPRFELRVTDSSGDAGRIAK
jgi:small-conductance mechanosensitive channel